MAKVYKIAAVSPYLSGIEKVEGAGLVSEGSLRLHVSLRFSLLLLLLLLTTDVLLPAQDQLLRVLLLIRQTRHTPRQTHIHRYTDTQIHTHTHTHTTHTHTHREIHAHGQGLFFCLLFRQDFASFGLGKMHFSAKESTTRFGRDFLLPFPLLLLQKRPQINCCFCLPKRAKGRQKTRPPPYTHTCAHARVHGHGHTHAHVQAHSQQTGVYSSETGRIRFRRVRFPTPNSVSFLALTEFRGENSVSSSQPIICVQSRTHRVCRRAHRVCPKTQ